MIQTLTCRMELAAAYGLDCAIFLHHIVYWVKRNESEKKHFYEGRYWAYASYAGLVRWFEPLWSLQQIKRIVKKCQDSGALMVGNFSKKPLDRTNWYSPSDEVAALYTPCNSVQGVVRNRTMHSSESNQGWSEIEPPNIDNINNNINNNPPISPTGGEGERGKKKREPKTVPDWEPEMFGRFWEAYPKQGRKDRQGAVKEWDKLKPSRKLMLTMSAALKRQKKSDDWQRGIGIPYAVRWIRGRRWEDEVDDVTAVPTGADCERSDLPCLM